MYLGIDPTCSETRPTACALLDSEGRLAHLTRQHTNADMLALAEEWRPSLVAIDSPLGFPKGMCCLEESCPCRSVHEFKGRVCERELLGRGISLYITTKRSFIKPMIYRAIDLAGDLESRGCEVLEVYPYASKVGLFGKPIPPKSSREGLEFLRRRLERLIPGLSSYKDRLNHDHCDALVAAYTARLHRLGLTESVGLREEVPIVMPASCQRVANELKERAAAGRI